MSTATHDNSTVVTGLGVVATAVMVPCDEMMKAKALMDVEGERSNSRK